MMVHMLEVEHLHVFENLLHPGVKALRVGQLDKGDVALGFCKCVQWPVKDWYQETAAKVVNRLFEAGKIKKVVGWGCIELASGRCYVDLGPALEMGPDRYGQVFFYFTSDDSADDLNSFVYHSDASGRRCIFKEGQIDAPPNWAELVSDGKSLVDRLREAAGDPTD